MISPVISGNIGIILGFTISVAAVAAYKIVEKSQSDGTRGRA